MDRYEGLSIRKANIPEAEAIMAIIQNRCKWLDENNIEQWNTTRTYKKDYYIQRIKEDKFHVATLEEKIVRDIHDSRSNSLCRERRWNYIYASSCN